MLAATQGFLALWIIVARDRDNNSNIKSYLYRVSNTSATLLRSTEFGDGVTISVFYKIHSCIGRDYSTAAALEICTVTMNNK